MDKAIKAQREAVEAIISAHEQGKRACMFGMTLLNRNPRVLQGIRTQLRKTLTGCGYCDSMVTAAWNDVKDMAELEASAR